MMQLLIVEDHSIVREGLRHMLGNEKDIEKVYAVASGTEALNTLAGNIRPDVIITDLHLGDMTGINLITDIKKILPDAKIVLLTMDDDEKNVLAAFKAGASGYILKEADQDELIFGLRKVAQGRRFICTGITRRMSEKWQRGVNPPKNRQIDIELSSREAEILDLIADGYTNNQIADKIFASRRTVEGHRLALLNKTGVKNTPELVKFAMINGLLNV